MILTEKVINKYMIDDKITKEHIEHLRDINYVVKDKTVVLTAYNRK